MLITVFDRGGLLCPMKLRNLHKLTEEHGCEAAGCMAWRWHDKPGRRAEEERRGYCGLAGRPLAHDEEEKDAVHALFEG